uniref:Ig-like domain-containing protein n=1 Tax=Denticeps clupeoides TaxID=299321 RepID=A0AAY4D7S7_9TELE
MQEVENFYCMPYLNCPLFVFPFTLYTDTDTPKDIFGEIGGKITLYCNVSSPGKQNFLYWQKMQGDETTFINGYYENKDVEPHVPVKYKNHFRFNRPLGTLEILHLSLKDRGIYTCVTANQKSFSFNLILPDSVNYSRPEILLGRRNGEVVVNCSSSAGHPFRVPEWRLLPENSHTQWDVVDNGGWLDNVTDLWSVFSTVTLNCSRPLNISCSVGGAISKELSICEYSLRNGKEPARVLPLMKQEHHTSPTLALLKSWPPHSFQPMTPDGSHKT